MKYTNIIVCMLLILIIHIIACEEKMQFSGFYDLPAGSIVKKIEPVMPNIISAHAIYNSDNKFLEFNYKIKATSKSGSFIIWARVNSNLQIINISIPDYPFTHGYNATTRNYLAKFISKTKKEFAGIDTVSGATSTSNAITQALNIIIKEAIINLKKI